MKRIAFYSVLFLLICTSAFASGRFINGVWVNDDLGVLNQRDNYGEMLAMTCYGGSGIGTCSCYTTTTSAKKGAIKVSVNGIFRWINFYENPN